MKTRSSRAMAPVDIRKIRQSIEMTTQQMGWYLSVLTYGLSGQRTPGTRVAEWEFGHRHVPYHVYTAATKILLDTWSEDRHMTPPERQVDVDIFYGTVLNGPLGEMFRLESFLKKNRDRKIRNLAKKVRKVRIAQMRYLQSVLNVEMTYVFEPEIGPTRDALDEFA